MTTFRNTIIEDTRLFFGSYSYHVGVTSTTAQNKLLSDSGSSALQPVFYETCNFEGKNEFRSADLIIANSDFKFGRMVKGERAKRVGEAEISQAIHLKSKVNIGETIKCSNKLLKVVGVTILPARLNQSYISTKLDNNKESTMATHWVTNTDLATTKYEPLLERGEIRQSSVAYIIDYALQAGNQHIASLALIVTYLLFGAVGVTLIIGVIVFRGTTRPIREALIAAGFSNQRANLTIFGPITCFFLTSFLIGGAVAAEVLTSQAERIGAALGQDWKTLSSTSVLPGIFHLLAVVLFFIVAYYFWTKIKFYFHKIRHASFRNTQYRNSLIWSCIFGLSGIVSCLLLHLGFSMLYLSTILLISTGLAQLGSILPLYGIQPPLRTGIFISNIHSLIIAPIIAVICAFGAIATTSITMQYSAHTFEKPNSDTYLTVGYLTQSDIELLQSRFPKIMKNSIVFAFPERSGTILRITEESYFPCMKNQLPRNKCNQWMTIVGYVVSKNGMDLADKMSPELAKVQASSKYNLALFSKDPTVPEQIIPITLSKHVDNRLDYAELPGLVIKTDNQILQNLGFTIGLERRLYIPDFSKYPDIEQQDFRRVASSISSEVALSEPSETSSTSAASIKWLLICGQSIFCLIIGALALSVTKRNSESLFSTLANSGCHPKTLAQSRFLQLSPYIISTLTGSCVGIFFTKPVVGGRAIPQNISPGWSWIIPPLLTSAVFIAGFIHKTLRPNHGSWWHPTRQSTSRSQD
ncbi:MAG: hypothetical protein Q4A71_07465 [Actinomycetaceae bacterium]|nr:hypothetical protein [Actinomycetaceae bacterium]